MNKYPNREELQDIADAIYDLQVRSIWYRLKIAVGIVITMLLITGICCLFTSCGSSGEIASGNVTNLYINSSILSSESSVQLISDDYQIQSIETQDDGNIVIVTLIRR